MRLHGWITGRVSLRQLAVVVSPLLKIDDGDLPNLDEVFVDDVDHGGRTLVPDLQFDLDADLEILDAERRHREVDPEQLSNLDDFGAAQVALVRRRTDGRDDYSGLFGQRVSQARGVVARARWP